MDRLRVLAPFCTSRFNLGCAGKKTEDEGERLREKNKFSLATRTGSEMAVSEETVRQRNHDRT